MSDKTIQLQTKAGAQTLAAKSQLAKLVITAISLQQQKAQIEIAQDLTYNAMRKALNSEGIKEAALICDNGVIARTQSTELVVHNPVQLKAILGNDFEKYCTEQTTVSLTELGKQVAFSADSKEGRLISPHLTARRHDKFETHLTGIKH